MRPDDPQAHAKPLTSLRFLAALWVLLHHALPRGGPGSLSAALGETGWLGVSLFFVLSGFLLTVRYAPDGRMRGTARDFWLERVARLAPTYLLALAFAVPLFIRDARVQELSGATIAAISAATLTLQQAWRPELACQWDCPAWSLSVEAWFYLAFPLVVAAIGIWLMRARARGLALLAFGLLASAVIFPTVERIGGGWPLPVYSLSPLARWPEFLAGIGLAGIVRGWHPRDSTPGLGLFAAGIVWLVAAAAVREMLPGPGLHLLPVALPGFVLLVAGCWALRGKPAGGLDSGGLVFLGEASYALYLFHAPLHGYLLALANRAVGRGYDGSWALFSLYVIVAFLLAGLVHLRVERPLRTRLRERFGLSRRAA